MNGGYVRLYRKSMDSQVWQDADLWKVWCWCLLKASFKETWVPVKTGTGSTQVKLQPGQFIFGRHAAAKELKMKPSSVRGRMALLRKAQNLDIKADTHFSIVTICNWQNYQGNKNEK